MTIRAANLPGYQAEPDTAYLYGDKPGILKGKLIGNIHDGKRGKMFPGSLRSLISEDGTITQQPLGQYFDPKKVFQAP